MHTLTIPAALGSRLEDRKFSIIAQLDNLQAFGALLMLWQWFSQNGSAFMDDTPMNRSMLNRALCCPVQSDWITDMLASGVLLSEDAGHGTMLSPKDYLAVNRPDNARSKGGHTRAASKAYENAIAASQSIILMLENDGSPAVAIDATSQEKKRAAAIIMSLCACLGRNPPNKSQYTVELMRDVIEIFRAANYEESNFRTTLAWIKRHNADDYRLQLALPLIIRQWNDIQTAALADEPPIKK